MGYKSGQMDLFSKENMYNSRFSNGLNNSIGRSDMNTGYGGGYDNGYGNGYNGNFRVDPNTPDITGLDIASVGIKGFTGLADAYMAYKQYQLGKDSLNFSKGAFNRNLANETLAYNTKIKDQANRRLLESGKFAGDEAGRMEELNRIMGERGLSGEAVA